MFVCGLRLFSMMLGCVLGCCGRCFVVLMSLLVCVEFVCVMSSVVLVWVLS